MKKGYALLLAVVITGAVLSAGTALANVVISEIRQTRELTQGIQAYVNAETNIEQALFVTRKSILDIEELQSIFAGDDISITADTQPQYFSIAKNDFVSLNIPAGALGPDDIAGFRPKIESWEQIGCPLLNGWLDIMAISWNSDPAVPPFSQFQHPYPHSAAESLSSNGITFPSGTPVEMRIRALYCDANISVRDIPGRIQISSTGRVGNIQQSIEAVVSRYAPVAGLFDFVIFSEERIEK